MKRVGNINKIPAFTSEWVDEDTIYLLNPKNIKVAVSMEGFKEDTRLDGIMHYLRNLWKALRGK